MERSLFNERHDHRPPSPARPTVIMIGQNSRDVSRRKRLVVEHVGVHPQANLLEIVRALRLASRFARLLNGGKHERHEHANNCDDHQKFNKRKPRIVGCFSLWFEKHQLDLGGLSGSHRMTINAGKTVALQQLARCS